MELLIDNFNQLSVEIQTNPSLSACGGVLYYKDNTITFNIPKALDQNTQLMKIDDQNDNYCQYLLDSIDVLLKDLLELHSLRYNLFIGEIVKRSNSIAEYNSLSIEDFQELLFIPNLTIAMRINDCLFPLLTYLGDQPFTNGELLHAIAIALPNVDYGDYLFNGIVNRDSYWELM